MRQSFSQYFNYIILQLTYPQISLNNIDWRQNLSVLERIHTEGTYKGLKYSVIFRLLNAADYGVPQKRERVVIVGTRNDLNLSWNFPEGTHSEDALLWDKYVAGTYWEKHNISPSSSDLSQRSRQRERLQFQYGMFPPAKSPWVTVRDALQGLPSPHEQGNMYDEHLCVKAQENMPGIREAE